MKAVLLFLASALAVICLGTWLVTGANRGWTKTERPIITRDEITGIEGPTGQQKGFWPGVDFLGAGLLVAAGLAGISFFFRKPNQP
jgi:hypothetical protein